VHVESRKEQQAGGEGVMRSFITCTHCLYDQGNERMREAGYAEMKYRIT